MKPRKTTRSNRNDRLEEAMSLLIQSQAALAQQQTAFLARLADTDREVAELRKQTDERFARIKTILLEHSRILSELMRMMEALPEAIREKFGFKPSR
jgi:predicted  nucleic acid-binding Zn-ribbon protein